FFLHGVADQHKPTVTTSQKEKPFWCRPIMRPTLFRQSHKGSPKGKGPDY
ncbi:19335_t:CDS:2, partial [Gigaspora rosea]